MSTETLHYETARHAQQLFNSDPKNLKLLEQQLEVKATSREGWIKLEGEQDQIDKAKKVFQYLEGTIKSGAPVRNREFAYALNVAHHDGADVLQSLGEQRIQTSAKKMTVTRSEER